LQHLRYRCCKLKYFETHAAKTKAQLLRIPKITNADFAKCQILFDSGSLTTAEFDSVKRRFLR
jgi:hypothetical protein